MPETLPVRLFYAIPVLGPVTRAVERDNDLIWYVLVTLLTGLIVAVQIWGLVALTLTALAAVPVMFMILLIIARP